MSIEVHDEFSRESIIDSGTYGYFDDLVFTVAACRALATTTATTCRDDVSLVAQVQERPVVLIGSDIDVTTTSTIPTIGPSLGDVLLSTEVRRATTALTRAAVNLDVVYKV